MRGGPGRSLPWPRPAAPVALLVMLLVALGLALRLIGLEERSLWLDEWVSLQVAAEPWLDVARGRVFDNHTPPLYYLLLKAWLLVVPQTVFAVRLLSVLLDVACLALLVGVVHRWLGRRVALIAGLAYALSPFAIRLAQQARMYPLLLFLLVAAFALALELEARPDSRWPAVALAPVAAAALYTHYYAALSLLVLHASMAWRLRPRTVARRRWWLAMTAAGLAFLPWLPVVLELLRSGGQAYRPFGLAVLPYAGLRLGLGWGVIPLDVTAKRHVMAEVLTHLPLLTAYVVAAAGVLLMGGRCALAGRAEGRMTLDAGSPAARLALVLALAPPVLAAAVTAVVRSLDARYLAVCLPFLLIVVAVAPWGRWRGGPRWWPPVQVLALGLFVYGAAAHVADPAAGTTPWRDAARELAAVAEEGAVVVVEPAAYSGLLGYHLEAEDRNMVPTRLARLERNPRRHAGRELWLLEVAFLSDDAPRLLRRGWQVTPHRLWPAGNGLRLSRLRPPVDEDR